VVGPGGGEWLSTDHVISGSLVGIAGQDYVMDDSGFDRGITHLRDLRATGASYTEAHRVVSGLQRLAPGAYANTAGLTAEAIHVLHLAAMLRRIDGVVASHASAAVLWGLPVRNSDLGTVHLSPESGRRGKPKSGSGHHIHAREVGPNEMQVVKGLATTEPLRTVLDCARLMDADWGVAMADASLQRGLLDREELTNAARTQRRTHGSARARALPSHCSPAAESPGESLLRLRLVRMGLRPQEQVSMPWVEGNPRVDFLVGTLVIEFDGRAKYELDGLPARAHWEEKRRHDRLVEAGYEVLHIVWADLWDEPALRARITRALQRSRQRSAS
jgi:hypothetical protein